MESIDNIDFKIFKNGSKEEKTRITVLLAHWTNTQKISETHKDELYKTVKDSIRKFLKNPNVPATYKKMLMYNLKNSIIYEDESFIKILLDLYNEKCIQAYYLIGKNRFKLNEKTLYKIITNSFFNSGYKVPMSHENYSDVNVRAVFLYHSDIISDRIITYLFELVDSKEYKGNMDTKRLKKYALDRCPDVIKKNSSLQLYCDLI